MSTRRTELCGWRQIGSALRARHHHSCPALRAELRLGWVVVSTHRTLHGQLPYRISQIGNETPPRAVGLAVSRERKPHKGPVDGMAVLGTTRRPPFCPPAQRAICSIVGKRKGLAASTSANPSSFMVARVGFDRLVTRWRRR